MNKTIDAFRAFDKSLAASIGRSVEAYPAFDKALAASLGRSTAALGRLLSQQASRASTLRDNPEQPDDSLLEKGDDR